MTFIHESRDFGDAVDAMAARMHIGRALVEKDYFVTHTLWALHAAGLEVWFKGGTSLSKGFGIIERFSEDLDLKLEPGTAAGVPPVPNWKGGKEAHERARRAWFDALASAIRVPGCKVTLNLDLVDPRWRSAVLDVAYPGLFLPEIGAPALPVVRLEVGSARVAPFVERPVTSWVHDLFVESGLIEGFADNRPPAVRCVHPVVTLVEKLDAVSRRFGRDDVAPASFVRHYEDAARIAEALPRLPPIEGSLPALVREMVAERQIRAVPSPDDPAFLLTGSPREAAVRRVWAAIAPMYWGQRLSLDEACTRIRGWIAGIA
ncbi:MAG: nucleotidyl transferase AbiEii/AbiGii toxin family protein [Deltaproteobacteria bacterium]|nr:nucleotidyl transferase AbiEii/AbiGii toxin family protein [Deltaproteobacteria bacterium]